MEYNRVNWINYPDTSTPINANNLNIMDKGISNLTIKSNELETAINNNNSRIDDLYNKLLPTVLYGDEYGTRDTITLSDDSSNYTYIEVYYRNDSEGRNFQKVYSPNGKRVSIYSLAYYNGESYLRATEIEINGNIITFKNDLTGFQIIGTDGVKNNATSNLLYITRVLGYKY